MKDLRRYQAEAIEATFQQAKAVQRERGIRLAKAVVLGLLIRVLVVMASGLGKTVVAAHVAVRWRKQHKTRILFMMHMTDALVQAREEFKEAFNGSNSTTGIFMGEVQENFGADVLFTTFQTMIGNLDKFDPSDFGLIIVDEAHHGHAETYRTVIEYFKPDMLYGMTATPDRMDGLNIRNLFGDPVYEYNLAEALADGRWLAKVDYRVMTSNISKQKVGAILRQAKQGDRKVTMRDINRTVFLRESIDAEIRLVKREQRIGEKQTIIFCTSINHVNEVVHRFPEGKALAYHRNLNPKTLEERLVAFRSGALQTIVVVDKFNEAIDIPSAELIVFLRSTSSKTIWIQQLGRGLRKTDAKDTVVVLDFVANCQRLQDVRAFDFEVTSQGQEKEVSSLGSGWHIQHTQELMDVIELLEKAREKTYISDVPYLLAEYMRDKNPLPPEEVLAGTSKKLWWKCQKPECEHEWLAVGANRYSGQGCPACSGRAATTKNCMDTTHPELAREFHPTKNAPLTPEKVTAGTSKKLWWKCQKPECGHEWKTTGNSRAKGSGCPACSGRAATTKNCMDTTHPELAREFHPTKNAPLTPEKVTAGTNQKLWWKCQKPECGHEWKTTGSSRVQGRGCPACANRVVTSKNCMAITHPELAREFHPTKNAPLTPEKVTAGTNQKLWWKCQKPECGHEWKTTGNSRTSRGTGCKPCAYQKKRMEGKGGK